MNVWDELAGRGGWSIWWVGFTMWGCIWYGLITALEGDKIILLCAITGVTICFEAFAGGTDFELLDLFAPDLLGWCGLVVGTMGSFTFELSASAMAPWFFSSLRHFCGVYDNQKASSLYFEVYTQDSDFQQLRFYFLRNQYLWYDVFNSSWGVNRVHGLRICCTIRFKRNCLWQRGLIS